MTTATPSTALVMIQPAFTDAERLALAGFLAGYRGLCPGCAARRPVVFPVQPGGIRRIFLGLMAYLDLKGEGTIACQESSGGRAQA
jgi:hypothetical protein